MPQVSGLAALGGALARAAGRRGIASDRRWVAVSEALAGWSGTDVAGADLTDAALMIDDSLAALSSVFELDPATTDLFLVVCAADLDPNFAMAYGLLLGADAPRPASVAIAMELAGISLLSPVGRSALGPLGPLRRWGLIHAGDSEWALGRTLSADESVMDALVGGQADDPVAAAMARPGVELEDAQFVEGVTELCAALAAGHRTCWIENPPGGAGATIARTAFVQADINCVTIDFALRPAGVVPVDAARAVVRYAGLRRSGLLIESAEVLAKDEGGAAAIRVLAGAPIPVVMVGSCRWNASWHSTLPVTIRATPISSEQRLAVWRRHIDVAEVADAALMAYRLTPSQIHTVGRYVVDKAQISGRPIDSVLIAESVRLLGGSSGVHSGLGWAPTSFADLQLPRETRSELDRFASWMRLRDVVTSRGAVQGLGGKGTGIAALFTGSPGTGKTLAAHVIADTAGLDLMRVDLSGVVDKYIGETEKNLERIFAEAESLNVVLFFDEADSLFGKRSEVRDAHDRFANQEVSYLLQRMEQFDGITVLATNLKGNLDVAFSRRLHFIVHFPDPDEVTRAALWSQLLGQAAPLDADDPVDVSRLAEALELSGGDIRNIVLAAVYDGAASGSPVGMRHVKAAAVREYAKLGRRVPAGLAAKDVP
ncbi:MAG: ATP-binding protein [Nakamurella sp.]